MTKKFGFTLAEVLITLAIIGVVAALTIPSVIVNNQSLEFRTGLKKAVSTLNQAITMNLALDNEGPGDIASSTLLMDMFVKRMNVIRTTDALPSTFSDGNMAFYTADGMRYELKKSGNMGFLKGEGRIASCTQKNPCGLVVDVNGDKKPSPDSAGDYKRTESAAGKVYDVFPIMITDTGAIPFGTVAQELMFSK